MKRVKGMPITIGRWFYARPKASNGARRWFGTGRIGFMHAHKGGAPVLIGESSWRTISGFYVNAFGGFFTVTLRRWFR